MAGRPLPCQFSFQQEALIRGEIAYAVSQKDPISGLSASSISWHLNWAEFSCGGWNTIPILPLFLFIPGTYLWSEWLYYISKRTPFQSCLVSFRELFEDHLWWLEDPSPYHCFSLPWGTLTWGKLLFFLTNMTLPICLPVSHSWEWVSGQSPPFVAGRPFPLCWCSYFLWDALTWVKVAIQCHKITLLLVCLLAQILRWSPAVVIKNISHCPDVSVSLEVNWSGVKLYLMSYTVDPAGGLSFSWNRVSRRPFPFIGTPVLLGDSDLTLNGSSES